MSFFKRALESLLVFLLSAGWFCLFQSWGAFADPDGFTHAKIASLIDQRGFLFDFPWLDLTVLHTHFVDQHLGLHLLEIPFIRAFGMLPGAQIAAVVFAALMVTVFYQTTRWLGAKKPWLWTILLVTVAPFTIRMSLAKSSPLAVSCFVIGIAAWIRNKKILAFFAGLCFSLVHGGWLLLLLVQGLLTGGVIAWNVLRAFVGRRYSIAHLPRLSWKPEVLTTLTTLGGCALGVLLHPNSKNLLAFLWVQVGVIGIQTPFYRVNLGEEWRAINAGELLGYIPLLILMFATAFGCWFVLKRKAIVTKEQEQSLPRRLVLILGVIALAGLTLKSKRYGEYFVPYLVLTAAVFEAELHLSIQSIKETVRALTPRRRLVAFLLVVLLVSASVADLVDTFRTMHGPYMYSFTYVDAPMRAIANVAKPGERIFHPQWDLFPLLFAANDQFRYISGMDPTYLFSASTTRSDLYTQFSYDQATTTNLYAFIHDDLRANYILFQRTRNPNLEKRIDQEPRFRRLYEDGTFGVYRVEE